MEDKRPLIVDINRNSLHDGEGIRTTIFFKGCPLNCTWCHNPEAISHEPEIAFYQSECISCGNCKEVCPENAIMLDVQTRIIRSRCLRCGKCVDACPGTALRMVGKYYEIDHLIEILLRDKTYYDISGGGVTLSGGEPTLFVEYTSQLLRTLKENKIHTIIETSGYFHYPSFRMHILPYLSLILYDIKLIDSNSHKIHTQKSNDLILSNFRRLIKDSSVPVIPRIPLIPGITTTQENLNGISKFLQECETNQCWLLPITLLDIPNENILGKKKYLFMKNACPKTKKRNAEIFFLGQNAIENEERYVKRF